MPIEVSIDRNIINVLNEELLNKKFLPAVTQEKIIVHLSGTFLSEVLLDGNITRRTKHSAVIKKLFNGHFILLNCCVTKLWDLTSLIGIRKLKI